MKKEELEKIALEVSEVMKKSKPAFFVTKDEDVKIPPEDLLYETRATLVGDVEMYFYKKINNWNL